MNILHGHDKILVANCALATGVIRSSSYRIYSFSIPSVPLLAPYHITDRSLVGLFVRSQEQSNLAASFISCLNTLRGLEGRRSLCYTFDISLRRDQYGIASSLISRLATVPCRSRENSSLSLGLNWILAAEARSANGSLCVAA